MNSEQSFYVEHLECCIRRDQHRSDDELYYAPHVQFEVLLVDLIKPSRQRRNRGGALPHLFICLQVLIVAQGTGRRLKFKTSRL
jgi:hypothetical protein